MPYRLCLEAKCPNPSSYRGRCERHQRERNRDTHRNRPIYNSRRWQNTRRKVLSIQPLCDCGELATDVDHIVPIEEGGEVWSMDNLRARCHSCHSRKTRAEQQGATDGDLHRDRTSA